ncbi:hypothetical protein [Siminovitchia sp. 179-K 8D1 HS]|uniref:hypothetical protein n=1 Tax=Siminovitchia sp. 179-K 8D1 HS TaxID=3142385 RepID=UPI0039A37AA2
MHALWRICGTNKGKRKSRQNNCISGIFMIDLDGYAVIYQNKQNAFTTKEFELIKLLELHAGQIFSLEQIYEKNLGYDA